ncbi:hypothetical protein KQI84_17725 [bacterium]|nr:hypothetical protein [bacterium]
MSQNTRKETTCLVQTSARIVSEAKTRAHETVKTYCAENKHQANAKVVKNVRRAGIAVPKH